MHRSPLLKRPRIPTETRPIPPSTMQAPIVAPSARAPASFVWTYDQGNSPPPYYDKPDSPSEDVKDKEEDCGNFFRGPTSLFSQSEPIRIPTADPARNTGSRRPQSSNLSIPHLREALNSLESKMASLLSERDEIESRLEQAVRLQSPVHRLPNELLASIFIIGVLNAEEEQSLILNALMLVCRHWKEVTLNTPVLWSRIVAGTRHSLDKARRKLERSQSVPLHVLVDFSPRMEHGTVTTESIMLTMDLLSSSIWRWKSFRLTIPNRPQAHAALSSCREDAPLLETLSIHILHSMQEDHYSHAPLPLFGGLIPRLSSCSITSFNFGWDQKLLTGLRVLKLGGYWNGFSPSIDIITRILRACPKLEEFALRNMSDVETDRCPPPEVSSDGVDRPMRVGDSKVIHLTRLTSLSFYYAGIARTHAIMSILSLPVLERVELCFLDDVSPVIEHLRRQSLTSLPLRHLRIESSFFSELKLVRLLHRLPSLTSLELVDVEDASAHLFKSISTPAGKSTWICPKLTTLVLEGCTGFDWDSLRSFVESRLPAQSRAYPTQQRIAVSTASQQAFLTPEQFHASALSSSSASAYAARAHILAHTPVTSQARTGAVWPQRLDSIDLVRCHQITKEMVQWLRMYVSDVKCETAKNVWG